MWVCVHATAHLAYCTRACVCVCVCVICTFRGGSFCSVGLDAPFGSGLLSVCVCVSVCVWGAGAHGRGGGGACASESGG